MESIRVIMLRNWHFDILNYSHWEIAWDLWANSWVISEAKEWAFVLIVVSFIPLWFTGWIALSLVEWGKLFVFIITLPWKIFKNFFYKPVRIITATAGVTSVKRKKSYKEIRPRAIRPFHDKIELNEPMPMAPMNPMQPMGITPMPSTIAPVMAPPRVPAAAPVPAHRNFEHALFKFDDSAGDLDFDIDSFEVEPAKPAPSPSPKPRKFDDENDYNNRDNRRDDRRDDRRNRDRDRDNRDNRKDRDRRDDRRDDNRRDDRRDDRRRDDRRDDRREPREPREPKESRTMAAAAPQQTGGSCADIIKQKGYEVISRITIKNTLIDHIGISNDRICLCLLDREPGDWLADEERFNDEEPLWFSESSHRISPVRKIELAKRFLSDKLAAEDLDFRVEAFVIIQIGNIINAEDMFEIWDDMNINVTRIDRGTPKEIKLFARALPEAGKPASPGKLDKAIKIMSNLG